MDLCDDSAGAGNHRIDPNTGLRGGGTSRQDTGGLLKLKAKNKNKKTITCKTRKIHKDPKDLS